MDAAYFDDLLQGRLLLRNQYRKNIPKVPDKYEFNKNRLSSRFNRPGQPDRYIWSGDKLGGLPGPATKEGIDLLRQTEAAGNVLILMCLENNPRDCHRYQDIGVRLLKFGIDVVHIHDGIEEKTSQILKENLL